MNFKKNLLFISYFLEYGLAIGIIRKWQISTHQMVEILISWNHLVAIMTGDVAFRSWNAPLWKSTETTAQMIALDNGQPDCPTTAPLCGLQSWGCLVPSLPWVFCTARVLGHMDHPQLASPTLFPLNRNSALGAAHSPDEETFSCSRTGFQGDRRSCYHRCQFCSTWLPFQFSHFQALWSNEELIAHIFVDCVEVVLCCLVESVLCWCSCMVLMKLHCLVEVVLLLKLCSLVEVVLYWRSYAEELFVGCVETQACWKCTWILSTPVFHLPILIKSFTRRDLPTAQGIFGSVPTLLLLLKQPVRRCVWLVLSVNTLHEEVTGYREHAGAPGGQHVGPRSGVTTGSSLSGADGGKVPDFVSGNLGILSGFCLQQAPVSLCIGFSSLRGFRWVSARLESCWRSSKEASHMVGPICLCTHLHSSQLPNPWLLGSLDQSFIFINLKNFFLLEEDCFTILCWSLPYSNSNQS